MKNDETFLSVTESANAVAEALLENKLQEASVYYEGLCSWYEDMLHHHLENSAWKAKDAKKALDAINTALKNSNIGTALEQVKKFKEEIDKIEESL